MYSSIFAEAPKFDFDEKSQAQRLIVGERWHVPIKVEGFPQPKITWTCNEQPIEVCIELPYFKTLPNSHIFLLRNIRI